MSVTNAGASPVRRAAADWLDLTKPRITGMVVVTAGIGLLLGAEGELAPALAIHALVGTWLVAAGSAALNHAFERVADSRMRRTADRPVASGRMAPATAVVFGLLLAAAGAFELARWVNLTTAALGVAAFLSYVAIYTPLKAKSGLATLVGAVPGAIPPMMGWSAVTDGLGAGAWALFALLFLWQLPHFLAIAWMCRADYARAGFPMLPVIHPDGRSTARQMLLYSMALIPVSLMPTLLGLAGGAYFVGAGALGLVFLAVCAQFGRSISERAARRVLLVSVVYLPAVLAVMVLDRVA